MGVVALGRGWLVLGLGLGMSSGGSGRLLVVGLRLRLVLRLIGRLVGGLVWRLIMRLALGVWLRRDVRLRRIRVRGRVAQCHRWCVW